MPTLLYIDTEVQRISMWHNSASFSFWSIHPLCVSSYIHIESTDTDRHILTESHDLLSELLITTFYVFVCLCPLIRRTVSPHAAITFKRFSFGYQRLSICHDLQEPSVLVTYFLLAFLRAVGLDVSWI